MHVLQLIYYLMWFLETLLTLKFFKNNCFVLLNQEYLEGLNTS